MRWTMSAFPDWFIVRTAAWLPLCVLPAKDVDGGNVSAVLADMAKLFCGDGTFNFDSTGMTLVDHNDQEYHFTAYIGGIIADEKQHKELACVRGAAGNKPCMTCLNVTRFIDLEGQDYLIPLEETDVSKFDYMTTTTFNALAENVQAQHPHMTRTGFERYSKMAGITYYPQGLPWNYRAREIIKYPDACIWDPMHILLASGGVSQYLVNEFVRHLLIKTAFKLKDQEEF